MIPTRDWEETKREILKRPGVARSYEELRPEYDLARSLIALRIERGLTQQDVAQKMNTTQSVISRLESGSANPSLATLKRLADALGRAGGCSGWSDRAPVALPARVQLRVGVEGVPAEPVGLVGGDARQHSC